MDKTNSNIRVMHDEVMACHPLLTAAEKKAWQSLFHRWVAFKKSDPSMYWNATATTIHGFVLELNSWRQLLNGRKCGQIGLRKTKQPEEEGGWGNLVKWGVAGLGLVALIVVANAVKEVAD
jgi:hypothetical protein